MSLGNLPALAMDAGKDILAAKVKGKIGDKAGGSLLDAVGMSQKPEAAPAMPAGVAANPVMRNRMMSGNPMNPMGLDELLGGGGY